MWLVKYGLVYYTCSHGDDITFQISKRSSHYFSQAIPKEQCITKLTPIALKKAIKNDVEITGMRNAHIRDAIALCEYFAWLEREVPKGCVTEVSGAHQLELYRRELDDYVSLSFATISSSGPNGAVIHYCPTAETDRSLNTEELYLCDSGGQYRCAIIWVWLCVAPPL